MAGSLAESHTRFAPDAGFAPGKLTTERIAIIGLGYVGLPVAVGLAKRFHDVTGFDINATRVAELCRAKDGTGEVDSSQLMTCGATFTADQADLCGASIYVVAVPTPVSAAGRPDFDPLIKACRLIAPCLSPDAIVVFESTVHPGATEEICGPELERYSGFVEGQDFHIAYSPERINPGDKANTLTTVTKIVAAKDDSVLERVAGMYEAVVDAGVHRASSIKVAEAAKVFENTQRDVNIALTNEFARICDRVGIPTRDVLAATGTKWNALRFSPGLVGGHCIGVDPLYLTSKAEELGLHPEVMLAARRSNERVPHDIAEKSIRLLAERDLRPTEARVAILGVTFKENVPDTRNSKVFDIIRALRQFRIDPMIHDPFVSDADLLSRGLRQTPLAALEDLDVLILAVPHRSYTVGNGRFLQEMIASGGAMVDVRSALSDGKLRDDIAYWTL